MGRWPRKITRSKHSSTPLIFDPCLAIKDFTALLFPEKTFDHNQVGQRRCIQIFGCGSAAVGIARYGRHASIPDVLLQAVAETRRLPRPRLSVNGPLVTASIDCHLLPLDCHL